MNEKTVEMGRLNLLSILFGFKGTLGRLPFLGMVLLANLAPMILALLMPSEGSGAYGYLYIFVLFAGLWIMLAALAKRGRTVGWSPLGTVVGYFIWIALVKYILSLPYVALTIMRQTMEHPILGFLLTQLFGGAYIVWLILLPDRSKKDVEPEVSEADPQNSEPNEIDEAGTEETVQNEEGAKQ